MFDTSLALLVQVVADDHLALQPPPPPTFPEQPPTKERHQHGLQHSCRFSSGFQAFSAHHRISISATQTRRATRTTRATAVKENENANARPSRISTRTKPLAPASTTTGVAGAPTGGVTRATAASRAKTSAAAADTKADIFAGKRKREALGEVAVAGNKPVGAAAKGKEKETFDGVVLKQRGVSVRQPLRTVVAGSRQTAAVVKKAPVKEVKEEQDIIVVPDEDAMIVDPPPQVTFPSLTVRKSNLLRESHTTAARRSEAHRRVSSQLHSRHQGEDDLEDDQPAHKKRRTSSVPPEEDPQALEEARAQAEEDEHNARLAAEMAAFAEEEEVDPEDSAWDDLDADDNDDPLMVSEYVQDIFQYLKEVEV